MFMANINNFVCIFFLLTFSHFLVVRSLNIWSWRCTDIYSDVPECIKQLRTNEDNGQMSLNKCKLICGTFGSLVPRPQSAHLGSETIPFVPSKLFFNMSSTPENIQGILQSASSIMQNTIKKYYPDYNTIQIHSISPLDKNVLKHVVQVNIFVENNEDYLKLTTNESYVLGVQTVGTKTEVNIKASTFFGARHALETLTQLIDYDEENNALQIVSHAQIEDWPAFPYRGFIIDTSRNFVTVETIKKTLDAMAYNKLNTFHWHITDSHSFPLIINSIPNMALYGAYSQREVYHPDDVRELVQYARVRGIRLLPEIDAPAHVGHGWEWGEEAGFGKLAVCLNKKPWTAYCVEPPCGQMNLANPRLYEVLSKIYEEVVDMFRPVDIFHFGGDEININCWNTSSEMTDWMKSKGYGVTKDAYINQWSEFQEKAKRLLTKANNGYSIPGIMWTSKLTEKERLGLYLKPEDYIIQIWTKGNDPIIKDILEKNYKVIFSNYDALYFDCGVSSWVGKGTNWCSPYKGWQDVYDNNLHEHVRKLTGSEIHFDQVLGGEAAMWTEQADSSTLESKLWPRGSALAERLWTNPSGDYRTAEHRMLQHRHRLFTRGIQASRLQPEWCRQNQGQCKYVPPN